MHKPSCFQLNPSNPHLQSLSNSYPSHVFTQDPAPSHLRYLRHLASRRPGVPASRRPGAPAVGDGLGGIAAVAPRAARHVGAEPSGIPRHVAGETVETAWDMATRLGRGLDVGNGEMGNILKPGSAAAAIPICAICLQGFGASTRVHSFARSSACVHIATCRSRT